MNWSELETRGFVVVRDFLAEGEIQALLDDFERGAPPEEFPHGFKRVGRRALAAVWPRIDAALGEIRRQTSLTVDVANFFTLSHYVVTRLVTKTAVLHQDFDVDYQWTGDHINYLNFWLPVRKPEPHRSNLTLVPLDALQARAPQQFDRLRGAGGLRWLPQGRRTAIWGQAEEPLMWLDFDAEELTVTPSTAVGDLVVLRGDVPHRTQDTDTPRVAASIRVTASSKRIHRGRAGPPADERLQALLHACLDQLQRDEVTVGEFVDFAQGR